MKIQKGSIIVAFLFFLISSPTIASALPATCTDLAINPSYGLAGNPDVKSVKSQIIAASGPNKSYCQVNILYGTNPGQNINIRVGLPLNSLDGGSGGVQGAWNGRTQGIGGGGCSGSLIVTGPVNAGYVGAGTDTGHSGGSCTPGVNPDGTYNLQFINDFIRNGIIEEVLFMKSVAQSYYGMKPLYNYWNGCSTGGRQGYLLAQELGTELDGILANAPAIYWTRFQTAQMWGQVVMHNLLGYVIPAAKLNQATASAVKACDANDGVIDNVIDDPRTCTWSAANNICTGPNLPVPNCLTAAEAEAVDMIWDGPRNTDGTKIWFGLDRGTALGSLNGTTPFSLGVTQFQWDEHDLNFDWHTVTIDGYAQVAEDGSRNIADVTDTFGDLDTFRKSGGKMLTYVGGNDQLIMPRGVINYYRQMASRYDYRQDHASSGTGPFPGHGNDVDFTGAQQFYRLFRAPGIGHCGLFGSEPFAALVNWVENGIAPDHIDVATGFGANPPHRRLCPYPQTAIYNGSGDITVASNYTCGGNLETTPTVCEDVLVKYKHEVKGPLDFTGTGFNQNECGQLPDPAASVAQSTVPIDTPQGDPVVSEKCPMGYDNFGECLPW